MELELAGRVDSDEHKLFVVSPKPTGVAILDEPLEEIVAESRQLPTSAWLRRLAAPGPVLRERIIAGLVDRGVLQSVERRLLWVFKTRVYPQTSGIEEREVKSRIMTLLNNDEIPDTRDALLIGLLRATGIMYRLLSSTERERLRDRVDQIANLEEINRALSATISELLIELTSASFHP
jgi:hypothetical protein